MAKASDTQYTQDHTVLDDGLVTFKCSTDNAAWPWLKLPPFDPIVVQTINYWASVETGAARGTFDLSKWSALTQTRWTCGKPGAGHATHGVADAISEDGVPRYRLTFFDAQGSLVYTMSGTGVVFKNRDFETWRAEAKQKLEPSATTADFQYASAEQVGMTSQEQCFLSAIGNDDVPSAKALITKENGFMPGHPFHSGSGDHVNSTHLADAARQFTNLLLGGEPVICSGGSMEFKRYVELGREFTIKLAEHNLPEKYLSMTVEQAGRVCANIMLSYE